MISKRTLENAHIVGENKTGHTNVNGRALAKRENGSVTKIGQGLALVARTDVSTYVENEGDLLSKLI